MENNNIDQKFNEASRLSDEPTVFPGFEKVWDKVEKKLDKKQEKKKIIPLWLPYGIAASLIIGLGAFYFINKKSTSESPKKVIIAEKKEALPQGDIRKIDSTIQYNIEKKSVFLPDLAYKSSVEKINRSMPEPINGISRPKVHDEIEEPVLQKYKDTVKEHYIEDIAMTGSTAELRKEYTASSTMLIASTDKGRMPSFVPASSLSGKVAGVEIATGTKRRGDIMIRGTRSVKDGSVDPLFVVDGIVIGKSSGIFKTLEAEKIKEVKIIKGIEAEALYGSQANNGVIIITTKGLSMSEIKKLKEIATDPLEVSKKDPEEKQLPKAGQLTAGEVNDFSKWEYWKDIAVPTLDQYKNTWKFFPDRRVSVQLVNKDKKPVVGEKVKLLDDKKNVIWEAVSDNLGNAELWIAPMTNENSNSSQYYLSDSSDRIISNNIREFKNGQNLIILDKQCPEKRALDIAFVVDATGSMGDEISYLQSELLDVLKKMEGQLKKTKVRYGSVFYRDQGDEYVTRKFDFSDKAEDLVDFIKKQKAAGGGDTPEAVVEALQVSIDELKWSNENSTKIMFLILDAPPHQSDLNTVALYRTIKTAAKKGITIIPLAASDTNKETEYLMRTFALLTNGTYTFLTNDSGIGNDHMKPTTDSYEVEKLNDLLLRLILQRVVVQECGSGISNENINKKMATEIESQTNSKTVLFPNPTKGIDRKSVV